MISPWLLPAPPASSAMIEAPLSSRTVRYISGVHFPPGISFTPNADLYGIENTNRGCLLNTTFLPGHTITPARSPEQRNRPGCHYRESRRL